MMGQRRFSRNAAIERNAATQVHRFGPLDTLFTQPLANFKIRYAYGVRPLGNANGVGNVVEVPVRDEDNIGRKRIRLARCHGRIGDKGIDKDRFACNFDLKTRMAEPSDVR
jgi:hypothetical protein